MPNFQVTTTTATLVASTAYTAIELRPPSGTPIKIAKWWVDFNGVTSTDKQVLVQSGGFSLAVTTATANTPLVLSGIGQGVAARTAASVNATVEGAGTVNANCEPHNISPVGGLYVAWETDETALWVAGGGFFRIRLTPGSAITATTANCGVVFVE